MAVIGADPEALRDLGRRFRRLQSQLEASGAQIDRHVRNSAWRGTDGDRFKTAWSLRHRGELLRAAELCRSSAAHLLRQTEQQLLASTESTGRTSRHPPSATGGSAPDRPGNNAPRSILELRAGADVTVASMLLGLTHDIRIEQFANGKSRVTFSDLDHAGAKATVGASAHVAGQRVLGASTSGQASLGTVTRRSYLVPSDDVWSLIAAIEIADGAQRVLRSSESTPAGAALSAAGTISGWLVNKLPTPFRRFSKDLIPGGLRPTPASTETLAQIEVAADASMKTVPIVGPAASLEAGYTIRSGRTKGPNGAATVFELEGAAAGEFSAKFLGSNSPIGNGGDWSASSTVRVVIPDRPSGGDDRAPMVVTASVSDGETVRTSTSEVDLTSFAGAQLGATTRSILGGLASGDPSGAASTLSGLQIPQGAVNTTVATFTVDGHSGGIGGEAGEGVSVGLDLTGSVNRMTRTT